MKSLREYITETQQWIDEPAAGDDFAINIREECLLESHVVEVTGDAIVIEADDQMIAMMEQYDLLGKEITMEQIRRYGAVGSSPGQGYTMTEGDIDPNRHPQTRDYGRGDDDEDEDENKKTNPQPPMGDPWDYVQDSEQDFRRVLELAGVTETEANTTDPLADKAAALAPVGADGEQEPVTTMDETQAPDQHLSRIRKLAGMAEGSTDQPGVPGSVQLLRKDYDLDQQIWTFDVNGDEISFLTYGDYDDPRSQFNAPDLGEILGMVQRRTEPYEMITPDQQRVIADMIYRELKKGVQQLPPAMPPAQDMSEGIGDELDRDPKKHQEHIENVDRQIKAAGWKPSAESELPIAYANMKRARGWYDIPAGTFVYWFKKDNPNNPKDPYAILWIPKYNTIYVHTEGETGRFLTYMPNDLKLVISQGPEQGVAEEREDREWSNRELEVLNKAERDFKRYLDSVSTPSDRAFNAKLTKKRMATDPLAGPKGQLPEQQGVAEGVMSEVDIDLRHIAKTQRMDALVDAMRGEFGIRTQQYLQDMMDEVEHSLQQRGQGMREDMRMKLLMLMDRIQKIYAGQDLDEAEYQGRKVELNKPTRGDVAKFKVYVKDPKTGNVKKVNFGDKTMRIKKSNPARRKSFRARHRCQNPGPKTKARYWACRSW